MPISKLTRFFNQMNDLILVCYISLYSNGSASVISNFISNLLGFRTTRPISNNNICSTPR